MQARNWMAALGAASLLAAAPTALAQWHHVRGVRDARQVETSRRRLPEGCACEMRNRPHDRRAGKLRKRAAAALPAAFF